MKKKSMKYKQVVEEDFGESEEPVKKWFEQNHDDPKKFQPVSEEELIALKSEAEKCHNAEIANYNIKNSKTNSNYKWMKTVMSKGTVSDRVAGHTVAIQDDPICNLEILNNLVNMVKAGKKKECTIVMDVLTELFLSDLLKPNQKLKSFHQRPLSIINELSSGNAVTRRKLLSCWYFEDQLKQTYSTFVLALNKISHDTVDNNKEKAISCLYKLLANNPEQEKNLLTFLVNKLGDPSQKVASKAIYCLGQLLAKHSNMQEVVLNEIEKLLFRANVSSKAQYYGLCFLSQFYLCHEASEVARRLIEVYFSFFKACVKKGDVDSRMMTALLMGVNRAFPYAKDEIKKISDHVDTMYRIVHMANFNIGIHALSLLFQVSTNGDKVTDRFYSALYKKLTDPKLFTTTYQAMLLSLIYKAMLNDDQIARIKTFIKRLLQLALYMQPPFACGILFLVSQLMAKKKNVQSIVLEAVPEPTEMTDMKIKIYDPLTRNPLYSNIETTCYFELIYLKQHFHPTISLYATNILDNVTIKYSGDPLKDFTLIRFLDRFVFKNPKKEDKQGVHPTFGKRQYYQPKGVRSLPINSENYLNQKQHKIPVDELFMYNFLRKRQEEKRANKNNEDDVDSDNESVQDDEFEEMLEKMCGVKDDDDDLDFMTDVGDSIKNQSKKSKSKKEESDDDELDEIQNSDEDDLEMDDDDDEEENIDMDGEDETGSFDMNEDDEELLQDLDDDDEDNEDMVFDEDNDNIQSKGKKSKKSDDISTLFASAEEFASLLEEEGSSKIAPGSSNAFSNQDRANVRQLEWEDKRNQWLRGFNKATKNKKIQKHRPNKRRKT